MTTTVPPWKTERMASNRRMLKVTCPRRDCGNSFIVTAIKWHTPVTPREQERGLTTKSCPFCFRASWVPGYEPKE